MAASSPSADSSSVLPPSEDSNFSLSFNQDHGCFVCRTSTGYRVFQSDPLQELFCREFDLSGSGDHFACRSLRPQNKSPLRRVKPETFISAKEGLDERTEVKADGKQLTNLYNGKLESAAVKNYEHEEGFTIVEMLYRTNLVALVLHRYSSNQVIIWDDHQSISIGELIFRSAVKGVRMRLDRVVVILEHKIFVYNLPDLRLTWSVHTFTNPRGLCALSSSPHSFVMACPSERVGEMCVALHETKRRYVLKAHTSAIACIALSHDGTLLATASTRGTLIRLFNTLDGTKIQELRRGADKADIHSIAFSKPSYWLVVSSDKGTVHLFCLDSSSLSKGIGGGYVSFPQSLSATTTNGLASSINNGFQLARSSLMKLTQSNKGSSLAFMKGVLPGYFSSEWSFAQFRLLEDTRALVAFGKDRNTIIILCSSGMYYKCSYDVFNGGQMVIKERTKLVNADPANQY